MSVVGEEGVKIWMRRGLDQNAHVHTFLPLHRLRLTVAKG